ncbi:MAG TPA: DUF86 domain-containing protein [Thermoanaerobaculia bacterium]|nr:DUF86 domain-containing protein [Thermoanaerobaculia bacterium]
MTRDAGEYVDHIGESMNYIESWVAEGRDQFLADMRTQAATIRKLQKLSESMKRLHAVLGEQYPEIPWRQVIAFRDVIVHDYLGLNLDRVWDIATIHVPALKPHIERIAADLAV